MMHSHKFHTTGMSVLENEVLILVVMDDALAPLGFPLLHTS